ncbi:MAG: PQQ-dependent dehydrogenase, methanol/ethanol family [Acidobacteria bacterium]|nr:PQQ-dependent dehydrogenase, methanol/ethanol family [Acidobacteriota bacterium]
MSFTSVEPSHHFRYDCPALLLSITFCARTSASDTIIVEPGPPLTCFNVAMRVLFTLAAVGACLSAQPPDGQTLFTTHCAHCHGSTGEGGSGPDLTSVAWQRSVTDDHLAAVIERGVPGTPMPGFSAMLNGEARGALVQHLRKLSSSAIVPFNDLRAPEIRVPYERLVKPEADDANWLQYGRDYGNQRFSPHKLIHRGNVGRLVPVWSFQTGVPDGLQATPLVVDGVIYLTTSWNHVFAIDARTGAEIWHYRRRLPQKLAYCCGPVNRGVAILDGTLYLATLDAHLVAINARDGRVRWDIEMGKVEDNLSGTAPPLAINGKVIAGIAGGDFPARCFIDAYDAATGKRLWRFHTTPEGGGGSWSGDSWKVGGGATWMNGSYDPDLNLIYWGTGNPFPDFDGAARKGDNLYTDSVVALDANTGRLAWHYQFTPGDVWDYDGVNEMVFINDLRHQGRPVKALVHADRNGHFYALDRKSGGFLYAKPFVRVTWNKGFGKNGRPIVDETKMTDYKGVEVCPGAAGGKEWNAMAYSPLTRLVYVPVIENCAVFSNYGAEAKAQGLPPGPSGFRYLPGKAYGKVMAIRADSGEPAWEQRTRTPMGSGMLATAGQLVFTGDAEGNFIAHDAESGKKLWSYQTGSGIRAAPVSFRVDGKQYIAIATGMSGAVRGFTGPGAPWMRDYRSGGTLYVFGLFEK